MQDVGLARTFTDFLLGERSFPLLEITAKIAGRAG